MKIYVAVKRVIDHQVKIRVKPDGSGVETEHVKMSINPFDEIAVEAAVQLKEQGAAEELVAVSIGPLTYQEALRHALALGMDRAILVKTDQHLEPLQIAKILQQLIAQENPQPQLILLGKQAIDNDCNQTGQMLAGLLDWPQATFASKIELAGTEVNVTREVDDGMETVALKLPAVITADLRLNKPRFPSLPNIMKSKTKPLSIMALEDILPISNTQVQTLQVEAPSVRSAGKKVASIAELLTELKDKEQLPL